MAGMFDGTASPLLVYRGATILQPLCGGRGPVVHVGRLHVEHVTDAAPAHGVRGRVRRGRRDADVLRQRAERGDAPLA